MPLFPFFGGSGSLIVPFKQKQGTLFNPGLLSILGGSAQHDPEMQRLATVESVKLEVRETGLCLGRICNFPSYLNKGAYS